MVTLGGDDGSDNSSSTRVIAACTLLVGHPGPSTPTHGDIDVLVTASPLSGPRFDCMGRESMDAANAFYNYSSVSGEKDDGVVQLNPETPSSSPQPTDTKDIESWIRRTLRSSRFIDPTELGIEPGKLAWRIRISIQIINHDGNVADAALLCACAALGDLKLPMVEVDRREGGVVRIVKEDEAQVMNGGRNKDVEMRKGRSLALGPLPVPLTIAILPNIKSKTSASESSILLVDPTRLEEDVSSGNTITMVCNANEEIVEFHKRGSESRLSMDQIAAVACMGFGRAKELEALVVGER